MYCHYSGFGSRAFSPYYCVMHTQMPEDLFRQRAIDSLSTRLDGRPIAVLPKPLIWLAVYCAVFLVCAAGFILSIEYARKETVRGWLVVDPGIARLAHNDFATVVRLERKAGDSVRQGEAIVRLSSDVELDNGTAMTRQAQSRLQEQLAAVGVRDALAREQFTTDHQALEQQLIAVEAEMGALVAEQRQQALRVQRSITRVDELRQAYERGAIARVELLRQQDELAGLRLAVARLRQEESRLERQREELVAARERLGIGLERQLALLGAERSEFRQRLARLEEQRLVVVVAPVDGVLATLDVSAGSTVRPQQLLATIIPAQSSLLADVYVPSTAIGMIEAGQEVRLRYDAFPHQQFGSVPGKIDAVAAFVSLPGDMPVASRMQEAAYKVRVRLAADHVRDERGRYPLRPGMALAADIVLERRSLAEWFFAPLLARI